MWDVDFYSSALSNSSFQNGIADFFHEFKKDAVAPFAKYQLIAAPGTYELEGAGAEGERTIQLSVWAASPTQAKQLAQYAIQGVKDQLPVSSVFERSGGYDEDDELFGYLVDFVIWFDNP